MWRYKRKYRTLAQEVRNTIFQNQEQSCMEGFVKTFKSMYDEPNAIPQSYNSPQVRWTEQKPGMGSE